MEPEQQRTPPVGGEEWFDVVDENDQPVGRERRSEVHRRGLRHRAVHVEVFDEAGRIFLQRRSMSKDTAPGCWDSSASGHVDAGETYDACAVRELGEELGWRPREAPQRLFKLEACAETGQEFVWVYRADWDGKAFTLHPDEIADGAWFTPSKVDALIAREPEAVARSFAYLWAALKARGALPDLRR
ncbi:MAG: NUDIX domain-containing protein [Verrucomicrobia bacterium]|nr:MAG: NUDIX domain-containing protein [Verrucomicrobiota bacterium]